MGATRWPALPSSGGYDLAGLGGLLTFRHNFVVETAP